MTQAANNMTLDAYMAQVEEQQMAGEKETNIKGNVGAGSISGMGQGDFLVEEELDISEFEIVSPEFFSQIKEPSFTVNVNKVYVNAACVRMLPDVEYVRILVNRKRKQVVFEPSDEMDIKAYRWSRDKDGKRYASQRTGNVFVMMLCEIHLHPYVHPNTDLRGIRLLSQKKKVNQMKRRKA